MNNMETTSSYHNHNGNFELTQVESTSLTALQPPPTSSHKILMGTLQVTSRQIEIW